MCRLFEVLSLQLKDPREVNSLRPDAALRVPWGSLYSDTSPGLLAAQRARLSEGRIITGTAWAPEFPE